MRRSLLFMPGTKPGNIINADIYGADSIIIDLEDAVSVAEKDSARILTRYALEELKFNAELIVRINPISSPFWQDDLDMIVPAQPDVIMPTKLYTAEDVITIDNYITSIEEAKGLELGKIKLLPLLETATSIENASEIARSSKRVIGLYLGAADLTLDMKAIHTKESFELIYARSRIVIAARSAGIDAIDTPYTFDIRDNEALAKEARQNKEMGFNGKACIYPGQVETVNDIFSPSKKQYDDALVIVNAAAEAKKQGKAMCVVNDQLIDNPILFSAQRVVDEYEAIFGGVQ